MKPDIKHLLPGYPKIPHLPFNPNLSEGDIVASNDTAKILWESDKIYVQEKVDGSNLGIAVVDGHPVMRNRDKFLSKGERKTGASRQQFKPSWNWFYENKAKFEQLEGYSIYGEWLLAVHGIHYNQLHDWFYVYDILDQRKCLFLDTLEASRLAQSVGLQFMQPLYTGKITDYNTLTDLANGETQLAPGHKREGVVVKVSDGKYITHLFKMVRKDYIQGQFWNPEILTKNTLIKG